MAIYIGNKELSEVYIGNKVVKEIYVGSTLMWSKTSDVPPIPSGYVRITVHFDFADDITRQRLKNEDPDLYYMYYNNPYSDDFLYFNNLDASDNFYIDVVEGSAGMLMVSTDEDFAKYGEEFGTFWYEYESLSENLTLTIPVLNTIDSGLTLTINADVSGISIDDYMAYYIPFYVNGDRIGDICFNSSNGDYYFDENLQFKYSNLSAGDVVTFGSAEHIVGDTPTIGVLYNGVDISNASIIVNEPMEVTFNVVPDYDLISNEIYIPYSEIDGIDSIRRMFLDVDSRYFNQRLIVTLTTNSGQYSHEQTYDEDAYNSQQDLIVVSNIGIPPSRIEHPDKGARCEFSYSYTPQGNSSTISYPITFRAAGNNYIGYLDEIS